MTKEINYKNGVDVEQIRTDVLVEMMHALYKQLWKIDDDMEMIQAELERREQPIDGYR